MAELKEVKIAAKNITVIVRKEQEGEESLKETDAITCPNRPFDEFSEAFADLDIVLAEMYEVPPNWVSSLVVTGLKVEYREDGNVSAIIRGTREFEKVGTKLKGIKTPAFIFDGPDQACKPASRDKIHEAIDQALAYYGGNRRSSTLGGEKEPTTRAKPNPDQPSLPNT